MTGWVAPGTGETLGDLLDYARSFYKGIEYPRTILEKQIHGAGSHLRRLVREFGSDVQTNLKGFPSSEHDWDRLAAVMVEGQGRRDLSDLTPAQLEAHFAAKRAEWEAIPIPGMPFTGTTYEQFCETYQPQRGALT